VPEKLTFSDPDLARAGLLEAAWRHRLMAEASQSSPPLEPMAAAQAQAALLEQLQLQDPNRRESWLQERGLNETDLQAMAELPQRWQGWCIKRFTPQVETEFLRRKGEFDQVIYSLLRLKDGELASELHQQLREGEASFAELAGRYSEGPEQRSGGLVGPVPLSTPHPALARLLQISQPGQLWPPKQLESWWIIVRLEELRGSQLDESMASRLMLEQGEDWLRSQVKERLTPHNSTKDLLAG
jgi:parvulin-like peptidyl-prolyl isomerase